MGVTAGANEPVEAVESDRRHWTFTTFRENYHHLARFTAKTQTTMHRLLTTFLLTTFLFACNSTDTAEQPATTTASESTAPFADRVAAAETRLEASPGGQLILAAINAHGGLQKWYAQSPLYYRFNYRPTDPEKTIRDSYILNDYVNARAVHTSADQEGMTYGFDGQDAWKHPAGAELSVSPRFWSLTPYYFVGLPFVLADEGINFEVLPRETLNDIEYERVKVTYAAGTGDADQDYYVLWLNPMTDQVDALNYIVSYPGFFPDGGHLPEKLMVISNKVEVDRILLPTGYTTRWSEKPEEVITNITVSGYEFRPETETDAFARPEGAEVVNDLGGE